MPRIKVCGVTDPVFALEAARRGVDYLGLIFAEGSPRRVSVDRAQDIVEHVRAEVGAASLKPPPRFVGVFVKHTPSDIADIAARVGLDVIQLHGDYGADVIAFLKANGYEVWRLFNPSRPADDCREDAVLLDGRRGNESRRADWSLVAPLRQAGRRVVLAGGISAGNISDAIATGADVIDVNSSIETAPGVKSIPLLDALLHSITNPSLPLGD